MFFAHALEILLHSVVEEDATVPKPANTEDEAPEKHTLLSNTVEFLDYFDASLDVIVGCARKIEMTRWPRLFDVVGNPKTLFEVNIGSHVSFIQSTNITALGLPLVGQAKDSWILSSGFA